MSNPTYSISDLARELDITTRTIRFYEEQGMLSPERRGLERIYSARDKVTLKLILRGKRIGFSLAECRDLIGLYDPTGDNQKQLTTMLVKIAERRAQLDQQLLDIEQMKLELDTAEERCKAALVKKPFNNRKIHSIPGKSLIKDTCHAPPTTRTPGRGRPKRRPAE